MPDLDLIKQGNRGARPARAASRLPWISRFPEDDEFVRPQDFLTASFAGEEEKGDIAMNCPNESEH
jgi:hypothetical protein